jgi:hypothetical protein
MPHSTQTGDYWVQEFQVDQSDIDHLYNALLELETPLSVDEMALVLVRYRVQQEASRPPERDGKGELYRPQNTYEIGDIIIFSALDFTTGEVVDSRPGRNPDYGDFTVLKVKLPDEHLREFACDLKVEHTLNESGDQSSPGDEGTQRSPEEIFIEYGGYVAEALQDRLAMNDDLVRLAGRWFPRSLLADVNPGHLNLAEAVLDINGGGPMTTPEILETAGILESTNERLAEFSLNYGLQQDERFDEVGAAGQVVWFLRRLEPADVQRTPPRLQYQPIDTDLADLLTPELRSLEAEIGDEHSDLPVEKGNRPDEVTILLTYNHRRAGTLPLSSQLRMMFPTAYEAPRIRFTLLDPETDEELPAWVVRPGRYVYGLGEWFDRQELLTGCYLTIRSTERPGVVEIDYARRRPRKEWVLTAFVDQNRLRFENEQYPIGFEYDDLMIVKASDHEDLDRLWKQLAGRDTPLEKLMEDICAELAGLNPQGNVHAKTLYSTVNLVRRCPPAPIFARLVASPRFEHVGGPYWQLNSQNAGDKAG